MSFRRFYYILFLSSISFQSCAETYFGVLRGNEIIQYKSPYAGIINLHVKNVGDDNSLEENENETRSIERRIKSLENSIETTKKSIVVERNKINYIFSRIKEGQDNIISYYQQLDTYEALQINLKEEEKELEFQKVLLYFIS